MSLSTPSPSSLSLLSIPDAAFLLDFLALMLFLADRIPPYLVTAIPDEELEQMRSEGIQIWWKEEGSHSPVYQQYFLRASSSYAAFEIAGLLIPLERVKEAIQKIQKIHETTLGENQCPSL